MGNIQGQTYNMLLSVITSPTNEPNSDNPEEQMNYFYKTINNTTFTELNHTEKELKKYNYLLNRHRLLNISPPITSNGITILENNNNHISMSLNLNSVLNILFSVLFGDDHEKKPISLETFNSFEKKIYSELSTNLKDSCQNCQICQQSFSDDSEIVILPNCDHFFDFECIKKWMTEYNNACPICRHEYNDQQ